MKMISKYTGCPIALVLCLCVAGMLSGCHKGPVKADNLGWDVTVHESVDVYKSQLEGTDNVEAPVESSLNGYYTLEEKAAMDSLLEHNRAYFDREDLSWWWLEGDKNLSEPDRATLLIYRRTPAIRQTVDKAEIFPMQPGDEEYVMAAFRFDDADLWEKVTTSNLGEQLIFMVNGALIYAPHVQSSISEGAASLILGPEKAKELVDADVLASFKKK